MNRKLNGNLAEIKVSEHLLMLGYEIYRPMFDNAEVDAVAMKGGRCYRVNVKYVSRITPSGNYSVNLQTASRRKDNTMVVKNFDSDRFDLLGVYIGPEDRVVVLPTKGLTNKTTLTVKSGE